MLRHHLSSLMASGEAHAFPHSDCQISQYTESVYTGVPLATHRNIICIWTSNRDLLLDLQRQPQLMLHAPAFAWWTTFPLS
jgi:hypothetical protein